MPVATPRTARATLGCAGGKALLVALLCACTPSDPDFAASPSDGSAGSAGAVGDSGSDGAALAAPALESPSEDATRAPLRVYLRWQAGGSAPAGGLTYSVFFGPPGQLTDPIATDLTDTQYAVGPEPSITLDALSAYEWRVEARDSLGRTAMSETRSLTTDDSVAGWWRFSDDIGSATCPGGGAGETVCDSSGNGHHGSPQGDPAWSTGPAEAPFGGTLALDGDEDRIEIAHDSELRPTSFTILMSLRLDAETPQTNQTLLDKREPGKSGFELRAWGAGFPKSLRLVVTDVTSNEHFAVSTPVLELGQWHYAIASFNQSNGDALGVVDGTQVLTSSLGMPDLGNESQTPLTIGRSNFRNPMMQYVHTRGAVDEVALLRRAIDLEEAQDYSPSVPGR